MNQPPASPGPEWETPINEADDLRAEDREAKTPDCFAEEDRKDRAGPHYFYR